MHNACFIDDEGGTLGNTTHDEVLLGKELVISCAKSFGGLVIVVGEKLQRDAFLLGPGSLCEGIVAGNTEDLAIEIGILAEAAGDGAKLLGADAGEGHRHEKEKDVLLSDLLGKFYDFRSTLTEGYERKIRGFIANLDAHNGGNIGQGRWWSSGKNRELGMAGFEPRSAMVIAGVKPVLLIRIGGLPKSAGRSLMAHW